MASLEDARTGPNEATALRVHGGRLDIASRLYPQARLPWIDLSTGINPVAYPIPSVSVEAYTRLPLIADLDALLDAAAQFYGRPAGAVILAVPGTEIAIRMLPIALARCGGRAQPRVGILGPTYGSHAAAWQAAGATLQHLDSLPDPARSDLDVVVVVNPNNPDGRTIAADELTGFARPWCDCGRWLVVDEAFGETVPALSLLRQPALPPRVTILRSLGKFFGLAGLRVGFVGVAADEADCWRDLLGDWPVSGPGCAIATAALADLQWTDATRVRLRADRARLDQTLALARLASCGGTDLFGYYQSSRDDLVDQFARHGILIRGFSARPAHYRFGLPAGEAGWLRLREACATLRD